MKALTAKDFKGIDTSKWPKAKLDFSRWRRWDDFKPYAQNARTHPAAEVTLLAQLILKFGPDQDIVLDDAGLILKGHGRRLAGQEAGLPGFPVLDRLGLTDDEKRAMRIQDNAVALMAGWDPQLIKFEIETLKRADFPMAMLGFGDAQLVSFTTTPAPPAGGFQTFDETIPTEHECPRCSYRWSGSSAPKPEEPAPAKPPKKPRAGAKAKKK